MGKGIRNWHENKYKRSFIKTKVTNRSCNVMQESEINLYFHVLILLTFTCLCYMYYFISNLHKLIKVQYVTFCLRRGLNFQKQINWRQQPRSVSGIQNFFGGKVNKHQNYLRGVCVAAWFVNITSVLLFYVIFHTGIVFRKHYIFMIENSILSATPLREISIGIATIHQNICTLFFKIHSMQVSRMYLTIITKTNVYLFIVYIKLWF